MIREYIQGGRKDATIAKVMTKDLAKFLYFIDKDNVRHTCFVIFMYTNHVSLQIDLKHVIKADNIAEYIRELEILQVGPSGQATKLQTLIAAINYMSYPVFLIPKLQKMTLRQPILPQ